ncbi:MAG: PfkB family carbohydrate kinase, partial [Candidatus Puniceispirillum sp.]
ATNLADTQLEAIGHAASQLAQQFNFAHILTTLSARGMLLSAANGDQIHDPASARDVFDVSGAGDTVVATMAGALAAGCAIDNAMRLANRAAGVVVGKSGTATVVPGEIIGHMGGDPPATDWQSNATLCTSWRQSGQTIAFANGCFDMLHAGHLYLLQAAADQADRLIVGLNGDWSVKRLKGESRPLQPATMRATVLASLPFVDGVVIFDEDTPFDLITTLQPDIIVKGGDYQAADIVGADIVATRGGKTVIVPTLPGHSTSLLVNRS